MVVVMIVKGGESILSRGIYKTASDGQLHIGGKEQFNVKNAT